MMDRILITRPRLALTCLALLGCQSGLRETTVHVEARHAELEQTRLYYELSRSSAADKDAPTLVFIPGGQLDHRLWDDQFNELQHEATLLRYDVRGFGRSGPTGAPYQHHQDLEELLEELELDSVILVGLSLGGRIAVDHALVHPERVRALVLVAPGLSGFSWTPEHDSMFTGITEAVQAGDAQLASERWLQTPYLIPAMERSELAPRLRDLALGNAPVWTRTQSERPLIPPAYDRLGEIQIPTLILHGERDVDDIRAIVEHLEREVDDVQRVDLEGTGHLINLEAKERFHAELRSFLDHLEREEV